MASTNVKWGTIFTSTAGAGGLYAGASPATFESGSTGANGFGVRMHARKYDNYPVSMFATSGSADVVAHNRGVKMLMSASHQDKKHSGFTWDKATNGVSAGVGTWDSDWTGLFGRTAPSGGTSVGMVYGGAVNSGGVGSYGGLTESQIEIILDHEVDRPDYAPLGNATNYKGYFRHVHNLMVAAGVRSRFLLNWCITEFGLHSRLATVNSFYPGDDVVDVIGVDIYWDFTPTWGYDGTTTTAASSWSTTLAWMRANHPTKPFNSPEFSEAESSNDTDMQTVFTAFSTVLNATANQDLTCSGIYLWCQPSSKFQNYNKSLTDAGPAPNVAHAGKHAGIAASIAATGGNAVITSGGLSTVPAAPTNLAVSSLSTDGTSVTVTVDAAPTMSPAITGERLYLGQGITTSPHRQDAAAGQPDHAVTTSYTFTGLTPNTTYTYTWSWVNSVGNSGWASTAGVLQTFTTAQPGVNNQPNITSPPVITQNTSDVSEYDFIVGATDPLGESLSYAWAFTSPTGVVVNATGLSGTTPELSEAGNWSFSVAVTNTSLLSNTATGFFTVSLPGTTLQTKYFHWSKPQTGDLVRTLGPLLRGVLDSIDKELHTVKFKKGTANLSRGLVGSAFDSGAMHSTNSQALTSGWAYWTAVVIDDDHFDEIWFVTKTGGAQTGTGTLLAVYDSTGTILPNGVYSGTNVDAAFQATAGANAYALSTDSIPAETNNGILLPGQLLYIVVKNSGAGTAPLMDVSGAPGTVAKLGDFGQTQPAFGAWNLGAGTLPSTLPFASWVNNPQVWMGLGASDVSPIT